MCNQQLEKILRKLDMEQNKVLLEEEKTKLTTVAEDEDVKCEQTQTYGKEENMSREKNNQKMIKTIITKTVTT